VNIFFGGKEDEDKRSQREWSNLIIFFIYIFKHVLKIVLFEHMLKKTSTLIFLGAWSFLLVHIRFTPSEMPKGFVILFF
jgi:hypothetical protein